VLDVWEQKGENPVYYGSIAGVLAHILAWIVGSWIEAPSNSRYRSIHGELTLGSYVLRKSSSRVVKFGTAETK
jgi:hypothetical protein